MGQQLNCYSKSKIVIEGEIEEKKTDKWARRVTYRILGLRAIVIKPETEWSNHGQVAIVMIKDRTHVCCKIRRRPVIRGERLIKLGNSWFSTKSM